jgi:spore germination protein KC
MAQRYIACLQVRMLDFMSNLIDKTTAPIAPIIKVVEQDEKNKIVIDGMAVFKGDKLVGRLKQ